MKPSMQFVSKHSSLVLAGSLLSLIIGISVLYVVSQQATVVITQSTKPHPGEKFKAPQYREKLHIGVKEKPSTCTRKVKANDIVGIMFRGELAETGRELERNDKEIQVKLGTGRLIGGLEIGIIGACEKEKRRLVIPPKLGFGKKGIENEVPSDAVLLYDVYVHKIYDS